MSETIGIYPGSFDPIHLGHIDLIERSRGLFDHTYVAVTKNDDKKGPLFTIDERVEMIEELLGSRQPRCGQADLLGSAQGLVLYREHRVPGAVAQRVRLQGTI